MKTAEAKETNKKTYVNLDQIVITEKGVLVYADRSDIPTAAGKTLSFDQHGMYVKDWKGPCWLHDLWCNICGGCGVILYPMNCTCFD